MRFYTLNLQNRVQLFKGLKGYPFNYALIGEELIYTIRFQNTGNAEAYDVVIRDTLDSNLDPSTFRLITSSHDAVLSANMESGQYLTFDFHDIFLPDSTTSFEASQGYVIYAIRAFDGIDETTVINNSASIYFDFNPGILTNTTKNVMVYSFDVDQDGFDIFEDCDDMNELINPDAVEIVYNGIDDDCNMITLDDDLDQDGYDLADDCDDTNELINSDAIEIVYNGIDDDCNSTTLDDDLDQDGYNLVDDCDDMNELVNPDAVEIVYNGIDDDCNELTLDDDLDQDGFIFADDCDDTNPAANPDATEIPNNDIDEDCDGEDLMVFNNEPTKQRPRISPNPTKNQIQVQLTYPDRVLLTLKDCNGLTIGTESLEDNGLLDLSNLPNGLYLLYLQSEDNIWMERIIKID